MMRSLIRATLIGIVLSCMLISNVHAADDSTKKVSREIKALTGQVSKVIANQEKILAELAEIKAELEIVKVRASM